MMQRKNHQLCNVVIVAVAGCSVSDIGINILNICIFLLVGFCGISICFWWALCLLFPPGEHSWLFGDSKLAYLEKMQ